MCLDLKRHHYPYYPIISNYNKDMIVIFILSLFHLLPKTHEGKKKNYLPKIFHPSTFPFSQRSKAIGLTKSSTIPFEKIQNLIKHAKL